jgi:hypothetical protein
VAGVAVVATARVRALCRIAAVALVVVIDGDKLAGPVVAVARERAVGADRRDQRQQGAHQEGDHQERYRGNPDAIPEPLLCVFVFHSSSSIRG